MGKSHLADELAAVRTLVLIDGAEDLGAALTPALLQRARTECILLTTRARPRHPRALAIAAGPWAVPELGVSTEDLAEHPTVEFFLEHAGCAADRAERRSVATILRRLEGVPELVVRAAERAGRLGVAAVRALLDAPTDTHCWYEERPTAADPNGYAAFVRARLDVLGAERQQTARAAALFPGGFDVRSILSVTAQDKASVVYALEQLLEAGLLAPRGNNRFGMLRPERELTRRILGDDSAQGARFVAAMVAEAEGGPTIDASARALQLRPNVEDALRRAVSVQDARSTVTLTRWLGRLYLAAGPVRQFALLTERLVGLFERGALRGAGEHAEALWLRGMAHVVSGAHAEAQSDFEAAARTDTPSTKALALSKHALLRGLAGDVQRARALHDEAMAVAAAHDVAPYVHGELAKDEANLLAEQGSEHVYERVLRARAIFRVSGHAREEAFMGMMLAGLSCDRGDLVAARRLCKEAFALFEKVGDRRSPAWLLCVSGLVEQEAGKFHRAANRLRRARRLARAYGDDLTAALAGGFLGGLLLEQGALDAALETYAAATEQLRRTGQDGWCAYFEAGAAAAQAELGRVELAADTCARSLDVATGRAARRVAIEVLARSVDVQRANAASTLSAIMAAVRAKVLGLSTEESRWASRVVARQVAARHATLGQSAGPALRIGADASWFERSGARVELGRRRVLHRLFGRLADAAPGTRVSTQELVGHVWHGEHVPAASAANRLYVAVARLRTEGLGDVLLREGDGYFLSGRIERVSS